MPSPDSLDFGGRDPGIALPEVQVPRRATPGPVRKQQFVVEIVGPRTVPSSSIKALLTPQWYEPLGRPQVFVMAGADASWRVLDLSDPSGAYDSVALSWDLVSPQGNLTGQSAQHLWNLCENFAGQVQRRAMAMPVPADVDGYVRALMQLRESLDIGMNFSVVSRSSPWAEREIWKLAAGLGLEYAPSGVFEWRLPGWEVPLLTVLPAGDHDRFTLAQVQAGVAHHGVGIGFSIPCCPSPDHAFQGCLHVGRVFASKTGGAFLDEDDQLVTDKVVARVQSELEQAVGALTRAGLSPGSTEALKLFGCG